MVCVLDHEIKAEIVMKKMMIIAILTIKIQQKRLKKIELRVCLIFIRKLFGAIPYYTLRALIPPLMLYFLLYIRRGPFFLVYRLILG